MKNIAIFFQDHSSDAKAHAEKLIQTLDRYEMNSWVRSARSFDQNDEKLRECDLAIVLGGDGTILHIARICSRINIPILGINFGRVGFLTELQPNEVDEKLPLYIKGDYWIDERAMIQATLNVNDKREEFVALNDIVVVRGALPQVVKIKIFIDDHFYNTTVADGVILSTATGSTAYNLAAGGPILHPQVRSSVLTPIAPHLAADRSLILEPSATVKLEITSHTQKSILSADGQINREIDNGAVVTINTAPYVTRFLRRRSPTHFYQILEAKLKGVNKV